MLERFLLLWLVASSSVAYAWPAITARLPSQLGWLGDPFIASKPVLPGLITLTMFCIGLMLPRDEVAQVLRRWPTVFGGTAIQYTAMPLFAFMMGKALGLSGPYFIGIVMVGCVPGAMASNVLTLNARGNTSYSVSLTTVATLLSPLAVPAVLAVALSRDEAVDTAVLQRASFMLLWTVVLPVLTGHGLSRLVPGLEQHARRYGAIAANLAILWIIAVVVGLNREQLAQLRPDLLVALLGVNALGYTAGYFGGWGLRLPEPMRRALTLEVGMQNAGLGATLATQLFPDDTSVAIAPAMYTFGCMLTGTVLARVWAGRHQRAEAGEDVAAGKADAD